MTQVSITAYDFANSKQCAADGKSTYPLAHDATTSAVYTLGLFTNNVLHNSKSGSTYYVRRADLIWDTSSLPSGAVISAAVLRMYAAASGGGDSDGDTVVVLNNSDNVNLSNPVVSEDIDDFGSVSIGSRDLTDFHNVGADVDITLTDFDAIKVGAGAETRLGLRLLNDINNTTPTGSNVLRTENQTTTPTLIITYTVPTGLAVDTDAVTAITSVTATLNGDITDIGGSDVDIRGFVYGKTSKGDPGNVAPAATAYDLDTTESGTFGIGVFDADVDTLDSDTTYYVRAVAHNDDGYVYGVEVQFDTDAIVYAISGTVTLSGSPVTGATIRCIKQSDNTVLTEQTSDVNGDYVFTGLDVAQLYHLCIEYETGGIKYNSESYWDVVPVEVT